jgi:regulator of sirC expression with transglutaminase-like and TPR domain
LYDKQDQKNAIATWKKWLALYPNAPAAADVSNQVAQIEAEMRQGTGTGRAGS